jgi:hypothetical protein
LKDKTTIAPPNIRVGHARLLLSDAGSSGFDTFLRRAVARFGDVNFDSVTGLSGAPVFDMTQNALCGMVMRGALGKQVCQLYFLDVYDIVKLLDAAAKRSPTIRYRRPRMRW